MEIKDVVSLVGIAVTFIVAGLNLIYNLTSARRTVYINTITSSRMKWIESLRDKVSSFIAVTIRLLNPEWVKSDPSSTGMLLRERDTLVQQIILYLNPDDEEDQAIIQVVKQVQVMTEAGVYSQQLAKALIQLREATAAYIKKEWEVVKIEARSGKQPKGSLKKRPVQRVGEE